MCEKVNFVFLALPFPHKVAILLKNEHTNTGFGREREAFDDDAEEDVSEYEDRTSENSVWQWLWRRGWDWTSARSKVKMSHRTSPSAASPRTNLIWAACDATYSYAWNPWEKSYPGHDSGIQWTQHQLQHFFFYLTQVGKGSPEEEADHGGNITKKKSELRPRCWLQTTGLSSLPSLCTRLTQS